MSANHGRRHCGGPSTANNDQWRRKAGTVNKVVDWLVNLLNTSALVHAEQMLSLAASAEGLSNNEAVALIILTADPGILASELGRRLMLSQPATAHLTDTLVLSGLLDYCPDSRDDHTSLLKPTARGQVMAGQVLRSLQGPM